MPPLSAPCSRRWSHSVARASASEVCKNNSYRNGRCPMRVSRCWMQRAVVLVGVMISLGACPTESSESGGFVCVPVPEYRQEFLDRAASEAPVGARSRHPARAAWRGIGALHRARSTARGRCRRGGRYPHRRLRAPAGGRRPRDREEGDRRKAPEETLLPWPREAGDAVSAPRPPCRAQCAGFGSRRCQARRTDRGARTLPDTRARSTARPEPSTPRTPAHRRAPRSPPARGSRSRCRAHAGAAP